MIPTKQRAAAIALLLTVFAGACAGQDDGRKSSPAGTAEAGCRPEVLASQPTPVEVTMWASFFDVGTTNTFSGLVDGFNAAQDKVRVKLKIFAPDDDMMRAYFRIPAGDPRLPDIMQMWPGPNRAAVDSGRVFAVQQCIDASGTDLTDLLPQALAPTRIGETQWGLPLGVFADLLLYDKGAFARAGLDPERPPATLAELRSAASVLKASGTQHPIGDLFAEPFLHATRVPSSDNDDGHSGQPTRAGFDSNDARAVLTWAKSMFDDGLASRPKPDGTWSDSLLAMARGESAMAIANSLRFKDLAKAIAQGQAPPGFRLGVAAVPTLSGPAATLNSAGALFLSAASTAERRAGAWAFLNWFEEPHQQARWHVGGTFYPARRSATTDPAVATLWSEQPLLAAGWAPLSGPSWGVTALIGPAAELGEEMSQAIRDAIGGQIAVEAALARATERSDRILAEYNANPTAYIDCHLAKRGCRS